MLFAFLSFKTVNSSFRTYSEFKTITGIVSDDLGPIAGANVIVKGTNRGTTTDFDGKYTLQAKEGEILLFTYVGYSNTFLTVGKSNVYNATLKANQLEEVVVVAALGTKKLEKKVTYAAQNIKGNISGVQINNGSVGASNKILIRGNSSIN